MKKQYLTINQAAQRLGVSPMTLRRWEEKGILVPKRSIGNQRRYLLSDIEKREKKAFTINEAAARLQVSANTLRRWETKGVITPKRSIGNQRLYTLADIQKLEAMHYPTVEKEETTSVEQTPGPITAAPPVIATLSKVEGEAISTANMTQTPHNDKEEIAEKPRFFDLTSVDEQKDENRDSTEPEAATFTTQKPIHADASIAEEQKKNTPVPVRQKPLIPWHLSKRSTHWGVALSSFVGVILVLTTLTKYGDPVTFLSYIPYLNISQNITFSSDEAVLQSATQRRDLALKINLPVEINATASVSGNLTAPNILYSVLPGDNITISGDPQNPVISATVEDLEDFGFVAGDGIAFDGTTITNTAPGTEQNIFANVKVGSTTISAGSNTDTLELAAGSNITLSTDTSNKKITIAASVGSSGISGITVQEGDTTVSTATVLDFLGGDFDVGESPSGEANISLASTLSSVTGVAGNFSIGGTTTLGGITYSWPGSQSNTYILQTNGSGSLSWIDPGTLPTSDDWDSTEGALAPKIITQDLLIGGISSSSARFHAYGSTNAGTTPSASVSATTSFAGLVVDNSGTGNIFTASKSGAPKFTILNNGNISWAGTGNFQTTLASAPTAAQTITLPDTAGTGGTICLTTGNCAGVGGNGDVVGPASSTDNALVRFNGATGKSIQNSGVIIDDSNNVTGVNSFTAAPATDLTALTLTGTNTTTQKLAYLNAHNVSGTILDISYGGTQTLTGSLIGQTIDLNNGQVTATNQNVTGQKITLPTITNTNAAGTQSLLGLQVNFGSGAGINQNGAGATIFSNLDVQLPALTQTQGSLTANGLAVTTPSSITTGGIANGLLISPTGVGAGTLHGVNIATISASGNGNETAMHVGSGWDTVLRVNGTPVINGQGVTLATGGGTGQASYTSGDILYANSTSTLTKLAIGGSDDYVLKVSGGVPVWGTITGSTCSTCVITNPSASATNTIAPTGQSTTGLIVRQTSTASPTNDIFQVTNSSGSSVYFRVDKDGNVYPSNSIGDTLTLTPQTNTTALTLVGTNVTTANLQYINAKNQSGTILNMAYGATQTLSTSTPLIGIGVDLSTNVTATNADVTATSLTLPSATNTITSGTKSIKGVSISAGGGLNQNGAGGTTTFTAFDGTIPALTQTAGTLNGYGVNITTPSSITTGGTAAALNVSASGVGAGTLYGLNISGITAGAGTETALAIGAGWDTVLSLNGTTIIDGSGNLNVANTTGILPIANGGSPFEQNLGAIFPRIPTQDLLLGGTSTISASFHAYGSINAGTNPVASIAANTSSAGLIADNRGSGDLFTASSSGLERFTIRQNGTIQLSNVPYNTCTALETVNGLLTCGTDDGGGSSNWTATNGALFPNITTQDLLLGGTSSSSALFRVTGDARLAGTKSVASISANTSFAGLIADNRGSGDLFTASSSGLNRFVIKQNGDVQVGAYTGSPNLILAGNDGNTVGSSLTWAEDPTRYIRGRYDSSNNRLIFENDTGLPLLALGRGATSANSVGIGTTTFAATLDVRGNGTNGGTVPIASLSATTSFAGLVVDNSSRGDIFTASASGTNRFVIKNNGDVGIGTSIPSYKLDITGNMRATTTIYANNNGAAYFCGGDDSCFYDINVANTVGFYGAQDSTIASLKLGSGGGTISGYNGDIGIGDTSPDYRLDVEHSTSGYMGNFENSNGSGLGVRVQIRTTGTPGRFMSFQSLSGSSDYENGWIIGSGGGVSYSSASDVRLKENIVGTHYGINDLMNVQIADFNYIKSPNDTTTGFLAQQLYSVYPPAVIVGTNGDDVSVPWGVDHGKLTPLIIKAVQDQQGQLNGLKEQVDNIIAGSLDTNDLTINNLASQNITLAGENINTKLAGLDQSASASATLGTQLSQLQTDVLSLTDRVASLEAALALTNNNPIGSFNASSSADLSLDSLEVNGQILTDSLSVLGYTTMNELSVTGSIRTGVLTIKGQSNGGASISTLNGDLRLQDQGFGGIDILDGLVTIDTSGNITSQGDITIEGALTAQKINIDETNTLSASVGQGTIPLNGTNAIIYTTAVTDDSHIFITPRTKTNQQLSVTTQTAGTSFKVEITSPATQPIKFDWFIIN